MKKTSNLIILVMVMTMLMTSATKVWASANVQRATVVNATYSTGDLPKAPMLNALVDDPKHGDEQDFVYVTNEKGKPVRGLKAEREYRIHIYYHAVVSPSSTQQYVENAQLLLRNFPSGLMSKNDRRTMTAALSWGNAGGHRYYRQCNHNLIAKEDLVCNLGLDSFSKANQAVFNTAGAANGENVSFGSLSGLVDKCLLGYDRLDGVVPCGDQYAGEVIVNFTTSKAQASGAAGLRAEGEPSLSKNQKAVTQEETASDDGVAPENDRELTTRDFPEIMKIPVSTGIYTALTSNLEDARMEVARLQMFYDMTICIVLGIGLGLIVYFAVKLCSARRERLEYKETREQVSYEEYQHSVREAADIVVIEALNVAAKDMHDRGEASLWRAVHSLIEPAMRRLVLSESTEGSSLLAEALEKGCRICFDDDSVSDESGDDESPYWENYDDCVVEPETAENASQEADWMNYDDCVEPEKEADSRELEIQSQARGEDFDTNVTTLVDERTVYLPAGLHFTPEELTELGKMTDCRCQGDVNFGFAGIHQLTELIEASDYCPKSEFWQKLEEILQRKLRAFSGCDASGPEVEAEITKLVDAMKLVQERIAANELSAGIDTAKEPAIQIDASGKPADVASLDGATSDGADKESITDFAQDSIGEADGDDASTTENQHTTVDGPSEADSAPNFGIKEIRKWAHKKRIESEDCEQSSKDEP